RIDDVDQVMRDPAPIGHRHFVGADVEPAIDGGRVAVDDLAVVALGNRQRQRALPRRGRAENGDGEAAHYHTRRNTYATNTTSRITSPICCVRVIGAFVSRV